jgi:hypothetical protein
MSRNKSAEYFDSIWKPAELDYLLTNKSGFVKYNKDNLYFFPKVRLLTLKDLTKFTSECDSLSEHEKVTFWKKSFKVLLSCATVLYVDTQVNNNNQAAHYSLETRKPYLFEFEKTMYTFISGYFKFLKELSISRVPFIKALPFIVINIYLRRLIKKMLAHIGLFESTKRKVAHIKKMLLHNRIRKQNASGGQLLQKS